MFGKADTLIDEILSYSRLKLSISQTIILDGVDTGVLISDFTIRLRRENDGDVPDIYFTLLDAAGESHSLDFNQNAKAKDRGSWVPFKIRTSEGAETVYSRCCCLRFCTQLGKNYQITSIKSETVFTLKGFLYKMYFGNRKLQENEGFC